MGEKKPLFSSKTNIRIYNPISYAVENTIKMSSSTAVLNIIIIII